MGALTDWADLLAAIASPRDRMPITKATTAKGQGIWQSLWTGAPFAGATPTTAVAPTKATTGAWGGSAPWQDSGGSFQALLVGGLVSSFYSGMLIVADRLGHQGGLDATVTSAQTTNLPTAALTRYTSGVGVMIGLEIYATIGSTTTTVSASYTNQAGTAGRTTPLRVFGVSGANGAATFLLLPLQVGDTGVKSVESVTVTASTGTAGNFGVTLFKPLIAINLYNQNQALEPIVGGMMLGVPELVDNACLMGLHVSPISLISQVGGVLSIAER